MSHAFVRFPRSTSQTLSYERGFYLHSIHHIPVRLSDSPKVSQTWLQVARWCGNTTRLVLVADNDIYVRYSPVSNTDFRITATGQPSLLYNGVPDWLYQGEPSCTLRDRIFWMGKVEVGAASYGDPRGRIRELNLKVMSSRNKGRPALNQPLRSKQAEGGTPLLRLARTFDN
ncbi:hypothetical protein J6590_028073 [Homalodisca vitripennis]|nr:hypothetical protein J6590_028073 [Homalodisca vitripennis]